MQRSKAVAVAFYLGAVLVGAVIGASADRVFVEQRIDRVTRDQRAQQQTFASKLSLTPEQKSAADSIFDDARRAASLLMAPIRPQQDSIFVAARAQFRTRLTENQQKVYDEMNARRGRGSDGRR
jgi:hypothetical protein